jgi:hypothetical protein
MRAKTVKKKRDQDTGGFLQIPTDKVLAIWQIVENDGLTSVHAVVRDSTLRFMFRYLDKDGTKDYSDLAIKRKDGKPESFDFDNLSFNGLKQELLAQGYTEYLPGEAEKEGFENAAWTTITWFKGESKLLRDNKPITWTVPTLAADFRKMTKTAA